MACRAMYKQGWVTPKQRQVVEPDNIIVAVGIELHNTSQLACYRLTHKSSWE